LPGVFDNPPLGTYFHQEKLFPDYLPTVPPFEVFRERMFACYEPGDRYSTEVIDFMAVYGSRAPGGALALFQSYDVCARFTGEHAINEMYWGEVPHLVGESTLTYCDIGAGGGETIGKFALVFGERLKKVYAFEPQEEQFRMCRETVKYSHLSDRGVCMNIAIGDKTIDGGYEPVGAAADGEDMGESAVMRLDDFDLEVEGKLCIKMDIEGYEMKALAGMAETIKKYKPHMAVCVYHKVGDIWRVPEFLYSLVPEYKCFLRNGAGLVCHASVQS
jgi:FkbM family methyltransferase